MAGYSNLFPQTYNTPYTNGNLGLTNTAALQTSTPSANGINWVQGEAGARSVPVGAGQKAILMDSETNIFYVKSSDQYGMPLPLRIFKYEEVGNLNNGVGEAPDYITREEFEKAIASLKNIEVEKEDKEVKKNEQKPFII